LSQKQKTKLDPKTPAEGRFVIYFPPAVAYVEDVSDPAAVEECIRLFFDERIEEVVRLIARLQTAKDAGN
jgi:hypothetical protein